MLKSGRNRVYAPFSKKKNDTTHSEEIMKSEAKDFLKYQFNVGRKDQQIRLAASIGIMIIAAIEENGVLMLVGLLVAVLAVIQWCPGYSFLGKDTTRKGEKPLVCFKRNSH